jgi:hypothetical protein
MSTEVNQGMVTFLRDLAKSVESDQLNPDQLKRVGEFFMSYNFWESAESEKDEKDDEDDYDDFLKFLFLGWYVYRHILS